MDIQKEREAFEQDWRENNLPFTGDAEFKEYAWRAWQAAKAQAVLKWISVENTIPNKNGDYIVCIDGEPCSAFFKWVNDHWKEFKVGAGITDGIHGWWHTHLNVTHWMPLPKLPKAQEQKG